MRMCLPNLENLNYIFFLPNYPSNSIKKITFFFTQLPIQQYTILDRETLNFPQSGCFFYNCLLKIHPIVESGCLHLWWNPVIAKLNFAKKQPKRQGHISYTHTMSMWDPLRGSKTQVLAFGKTSLKYFNEDDIHALLSENNFLRHLHDRMVKRLSFKLYEFSK